MLNPLSHKPIHWRHAGRLHPHAAETLWRTRHHTGYNGCDSPRLQESTQMSGVIPENYTDLLTRELYVHLGTLNADGSPQVTPMWQLFDGTFIRFTTSTVRAKYRNLQRDSRVAISVNDPDNPYRYLEVRGVVDHIDPDPEGEFFDVLARRYGMDYTKPIGDAATHVALVVRPIHSTFQG
jgi:PPOX class probable F420-dependent enzyme